FEAWLRLQLGDVDVAVVIGSGKSSPGRPREVFALQTDPYVMAPLGMDPVSLAGIQARALLDAGKAPERDFAEVAVRSRRAARQNPHAQLATDETVDDLLAAPYFSAPLRRHDLPPISDGAAAVVIAAGDRARELTDCPAWIRGMDHRIESHHPGLRDLTRSVSTKLAAERVALADGPIDVAELMVNYSPEELILRDALGLSNGTAVNPSGGPLAGHPVMATGLIRVTEVADRIRSGSAGPGAAPPSNPPALPPNPPPPPPPGA